MRAHACPKIPQVSLVQGGLRMLFLLLFACWLLVSVQRWRSSQPLLGPYAGLWYEDMSNGAAVPVLRIAAAALLEAAYVATTLGFGAMCSLLMRVHADSRAALSERVCGIRLVQERNMRHCGDSLQRGVVHLR